MSKTLNTISKLLAKAENTDSVEEAATFMAKAQEMASINNIDLAVARMHQARQERVREPEERSVQVNPYGRRHNRKHFAELGMAICDVNDIKYLISGSEYKLFCVGFPEDIDVMEALFAHLSVQMVLECDEALARGDHKETRLVPQTTKVEIPFESRAWGYWDGKDRCYDDDPVEGGDFDTYEDYETHVAQGGETFNYSTGRFRKSYPPPRYEENTIVDEEGNPVMVEKTLSRVDGRVFRNEFYGSFVRRMRGRLWEIRKSVERERGVEEATSETAVALRDKKEEVDKADEERRAKVHHLGSYRGSDEVERKRDFSGIAQRAGTRSAETVPIDDGRAVK